MSRRKKSGDSGGAMPATGAGLIRFFEEDTQTYRKILTFSVVMEGYSE